MFSGWEDRRSGRQTEEEEEEEELSKPELAHRVTCNTKSAFEHAEINSGRRSSPRRAITRRGLPEDAAQGPALPWGGKGKTGGGAGPEEKGSRQRS